MRRLSPFLSLLTLALSACGGGPEPVGPPAPGPATADPIAIDGIRHTVRAGETVYGIARQYGVDILDILRANRIDKPEALVAGRVLVIPGVEKPAPAADVPEAAPRTDPIPPIESTWVSPLPGTGNAAAGGARSYGAHAGQPVKAPFSARVAYAGPIVGLRHGVLLEGADGTKLLLADMASVTVAAGQAVRQSDPLGVAGAASGKSACLWIAASRNGKVVDLGMQFR